MGKLGIEQYFREKKMDCHPERSERSAFRPMEKLQIPRAKTRRSE
jgi:hypothetical protein